MSLSVEELDQTVKSFYEGRGEVVRTSANAKGKIMNKESNESYSKSRHRTPSTRYSKVAPNSQHARLAIADVAPQFKENPDAWLLVDKILQEASYPQTKCT